MEQEVVKTKEEMIAELQSRQLEIMHELSSMDYLDIKEADGDDMTQYGDFRAKRRELRAEYNNAEKAIKMMMQDSKQSDLPDLPFCENGV